MNESTQNSAALMNVARELLEECRLEEAVDILENVPPTCSEGALATEWLAGIFLWTGQPRRARMAIGQRSAAPLPDRLRLKMLQACLAEGDFLKASDFLLSTKGEAVHVERNLAMASYYSSVGNFYHAAGWLQNIDPRELRAERWLMDPWIWRLWHYCAKCDAPPELLRGIGMLSRKFEMETFFERIGNPMEVGILSRQDIVPEYCPLFSPDILAGVARIDPSACLRHPSLAASFMQWSSSLMEQNMEAIRKGVRKSTGTNAQAVWLPNAKTYISAGRFHTARGSVLESADQCPTVLDLAIDDASLGPISDAIRDLQCCRDAYPGALSDLLALEKLSEGKETDRAFEVLGRLSATAGDLTHLQHKRAILHFYDRSYEQAFELANAVADQWPDDPTPFFIAAESLRCMGRFDEAADVLLSAPPNIVFLPQAKPLAASLRKLGHVHPLFESLDWMHPLSEKTAAGRPDAFIAVGIIDGGAVANSNDWPAPAKYFLESLPSLAPAEYRCRQFLHEILRALHLAGMDAEELIGWAEKFSLSAHTIPSSAFCPRAVIRQLAREITLSNHQPTYATT